jgi:hypothetical protein
MKPTNEVIVPAALEQNGDMGRQDGIETSKLKSAFLFVFWFSVNGRHNG